MLLQCLQDSQDPFVHAACRDRELIDEFVQRSRIPPAPSLSGIPLLLGLRASEVGRLELRDYNPHTERIYVHRLKRSNSGEHHLVREESKALRAWLKVRGAVPGAIFLSNRRSPIQRRMLDVLMKKYGAAAGIPPKLCHFHVLKHTCVTHLNTSHSAFHCFLWCFRK